MHFCLVATLNFRFCAAYKCTFCSGKWMYTRSWQQQKMSPWALLFTFCSIPTKRVAFQCIFHPRFSLFKPKGFFQNCLFSLCIIVNSISLQRETLFFFAISNLWRLSQFFLILCASSSLVAVLVGLWAKLGQCK